jgi:tripartite-type tricarboxylate transporter receptor subunit TctC
MNDHAKSATRKIYQYGIAAAVAALALTAFTGRASAQDYPTRGISIIVGYGPGTGIDIIAREVGMKLTVSMGKPVTIENKAGAAGSIGSDYVAQSRADGYTLLITSTTGIINEVIGPTRSKLIKDFDPVAFSGTIPYALAVPAIFPARTTAELIAEAKRKPGQLNYVGLVGGIPQFLGEMFKATAGIDIVMVPYKSTPDAQIDVLSGRVPIWFTTAASAINLAKTNRVHILAVTSDKRIGAAPDVPTMSEAGLSALNVEVTFFFLVPIGTPKPIINRLNRDIANAMSNRELVDRLAGQGVEPKIGSGEEVTKHVQSELARWEKVVAASKK